MKLTLTRTALLILTALLVTSSLAFAGQFSVSPVIATLGESKRIDSLTLKNESKYPVTIQVKLFSWSQDEQGKDTITPSDDLSYMPRIFQLKPGEERSMRIGYTPKTSPPQEKAYRIYLTEQPQAKTDPEEKSQLKVALSMGVPVFVMPKEPLRDKGTIGNPSASKGVATVAVQNSGNSRLVMKSTVLTGVDATGAKVFEVDMGRQFVLAGMKKNISAKLPADTCGKAATITVSGELESGGSLTATAPLPAGACAE